MDNADPKCNNLRPATPAVTFSRHVNQQQRKQAWAKSEQKNEAKLPKIDEAIVYFNEAEENLFEKEVERSQALRHQARGSGEGIFRLTPTSITDIPEEKPDPKIYGNRVRAFSLDEDS